MIIIRSITTAIDGKKCMKVSRKVEINNKQAVEYLAKRRPFILKGRKLTRELEKLEKEAGEIAKKAEELTKQRQKCGLEAQKWQDKVVPLIEKQKIDIKPTEEMRTVEEVKGKVYVTIVDAVKEYEERYLEQKNAKHNSGNK